MSFLKRSKHDDGGLSGVQSEVGKLHEKYLKLIKQRHIANKSIQLWASGQGPEIARFANTMVANEERSNMLLQEYSHGIDTFNHMWNTLIEDKKELATVEAELQRTRANVEKYREKEGKHEQNLRKLPPMSDKFQLARQKTLDYAQKEAITQMEERDREIQLHEKLKQLYMHEHDALRSMYYSMTIMRVKHLKAQALMEMETLREIEKFPQIRDFSTNGFEYSPYERPMGVPLNSLFDWVDESKLRNDPDVMSALSYTIPMLPHASSIPHGVQPETEHIRTPAATLAQITQAAMPNEAEIRGVHPTALQYQQGYVQQTSSPYSDEFYQPAITNGSSRTAALGYTPSFQQQQQPVQQLQQPVQQPIVQPTTVERQMPITSGVQDLQLNQGQSFALQQPSALSAAAPSFQPQVDQQQQFGALQQDNLSAVQPLTNRHRRDEEVAVAGFIPSNEMEAGTWTKHVPEIKPVSQPIVGQDRLEDRNLQRDSSNIIPVQLDDVRPFDSTQSQDYQRQADTISAPLTGSPQQTRRRINHDDIPVGTGRSTYAISEPSQQQFQQQFQQQPLGFQQQQQGLQDQTFQQQPQASTFMTGRGNQIVNQGLDTSSRKGFAVDSSPLIKPSDVKQRRVENDTMYQSTAGI